MSYFISPPDKTDLAISLAISVEDFVTALNAKWPDIEIKAIDNPESNHLLEWKMMFNNRLLIGTLDNTRQVVHLDGDIRDCAKFAQWYRTQVAADYTLAFYDEGFSADVTLSTDISEQQIAEPFLI